MADLIRVLLKASEKSAEIARTWIQQDELFSLLVEEKVGEAKNDRFIQDFKTLADVLVQEAIKHEVLSKFSDLQGHIYGEEPNQFINSEGSCITVEIKENRVSTAKHLREVMNGNDTAATLLANIVHQDVNIATDADEQLRNLDCELDIKDLGIWIDPIDGTAEYISRSLGKTEKGILCKGLPCATVLIGIFDKTTGRPLGGVINQPFSRYDEKNKIWTGQRIWGIISKSHPLSANSLISNNLVTNKNSPSKSSESKPFTIVISISEETELKEKLKTAGFQIHEIAAVGFKLLKVIDGTVNIYLLSKGSSFKWDTCAAHSILRSMGGGVVSFQKAVQIATGSGFLDSNVLIENLKDTQLFYHKPDDEFSEPGKRWSNSGGLIAYRHYKDLIIFLQALIK